MAASLGESSERFSVRLPHSDGRKSQYLDEYMEVGKKDLKTGELTRFIFSKEEKFGLEITLKAGFNHGYYDSVMVKLSDVNSGDVIWQKKHPKSNVKEPSQQDQKILIGSIDHAIIDGELRSKVFMKLAPLVPENDFIKPGANKTCRYPRMLEGLCIEICKYKGAGDVLLTEEEFDLKLKEHAFKLESYARIDGRGSLDTPKRTVVHRNVYQTHNITHKLRRTPIAPIRKSWELLTPREREIAYGELSKYNFQQIWSHHFKAPGPKPNKVATDALKNQLREDLPDYWRSWHKLYLYEIPRAFKLLQERRRFLDRGEIPEDTDIIGKCEETPIKLENAPKRLEKSSEKIRVPSLTRSRRSAFPGSPESSPKLTIAPMYEPEISAQSNPIQTAAGISSAAKSSIKTEPPGASILGRVSASTPGVFGPDKEKLLCLECHQEFDSDKAYVDHFQPTHGRTSEYLNQAMMDKIIPDAFSTVIPRVWPNSSAMNSINTASSRLTTTSSSELPAPKPLTTPSSMSSHTEHGTNHRATKLATNDLSNSKSSSTEISVPKTITEPIPKAPKRLAGIADLSRLKRPSSKMRRIMGYMKCEVAMHHSPLAIEQPTRPSVLSPACVESCVSEKDNLTDPLKLDNSRMIVAADPAKSGARLASSFTTTVVSPSLQTALLSVSSCVNPEASQIASSSTAEALPVLPPLNPEPSSTGIQSTNLSMITSSISHFIPVLETSNIKSFEIRSSPAFQEVDSSAELPATVKPDIETPSDIEPSTRLAANMPSAMTETTTSSVIPFIDLDTWVSSPDFIATYSSNSSSVSIIKSETDTDKKPQLKVDEDLKIPEADIKDCEEEAKRQETELEDAIRIAEARKELYRVRRKFETLRSGSL
ncbi:hypothetical protein BCON_0095g00090 [Botryotinia convoluta]|uniref:C2H2-type domain-containing protein n=1 Tax=Botryotinia convoluta TaxID=54673 RepID=A0A4Z1I1K7_9HELO|nr:hypothetical protein BCON_0095g00090 [Botryotinia convoluta]